MREQLRILLVEDVASDAELALRELKRAGLGCIGRRAETEEEFRRGIGDFNPHVILSDFSMPHFDGMAALAIAREACPDVPFIFVSGTVGEEYAIRALKNGASDYVLKSNLIRLPPTVERALRDTQELAARRRAEAELHEREEQFRQLAENIRDVFWIVSVDGGAGIYVSPAYEQIWGRTLQNLRENPAAWTEAIHPDDRERIREAMAKTLTGATLAYDSEYRIVRPDGSVRWIHDRGFPIKDAQGHLYRIAGVAEDITERKTHQEKVRFLAYYDALTGLPNRALCLEQLTQSTEAAKLAQRRAAVALIDIERFRIITDSLGRSGGDALLKQVAARLQGAIGGANDVARFNADCFAAVFTDVREAVHVSQLFESKILPVFNQPFTVNAQELRISVKSGIALFPEDGGDADALLRNAEAALDKAKVSSERYLFYVPEMNARVAEKLSLENKLRKALEAEQFVLYYQPKVNTKNREVTGLEALIRWNDPDDGVVPPVKFIPILEETGLILDVGSWAIRQALADFEEWAGKGLRVPRIAVNVSAVQLKRKDFVEVVQKATREGKVAAQSLDLEITESLIMEDIEGNIKKLRAIRDMGIGIAIDDFGTGYSSLGYLAKLPVNTLKIDRSFIVAMSADADGMTIVSTMISLAHSLKLNVVAEGVETEEQARFLKLLNCDQMQGYLFSKPRPPDKVAEFLPDAAAPPPARGSVDDWSNTFPVKDGGGPTPLNPYRK